MMTRGAELKAYHRADPCHLPIIFVVGRLATRQRDRLAFACGAGAGEPAGPIQTPQQEEDGRSTAQRVRTGVGGGAISGDGNKHVLATADRARALSNAVVGSGEGVQVPLVVTGGMVCPGRGGGCETVQRERVGSRPNACSNALDQERSNADRARVLSSAIIGSCGCMQAQLLLRSTCNREFCRSRGP